MKGRLAKSIVSRFVGTAMSAVLIFGDDAANSVYHNLRMAYVRALQKIQYLCARDFCMYITDDPAHRRVAASSR